MMSELRITSQYTLGQLLPLFKKLLENHQPITVCTQWFAQQRQWLLIDDLI